MPPIMTAQDRSGWLTVPAMARRLGVSEATLKRRIRDGKPVVLAAGQVVEIDVEMVERPQGHEWRVKVRGEMPAFSTDQAPADSEEAAPIRGDQEQSRALDILDAVIRANAETMERQAERLDRYSELVRQEQERRVRAEAASEEASRRISDLEAALAAERAETARLREQAERRRWWRWW